LFSARGKPQARLFLLSEPRSTEKPLRAIGCKRLPFRTLARNWDLVCVVHPRIDSRVLKLFRYYMRLELASGPKFQLSRIGDQGRTTHGGMSHLKLCCAAPGHMVEKRIIVFLVVYSSTAMRRPLKATAHLVEACRCFSQCCYAPSRENPSLAQRTRTVRAFLRPRGELGPRPFSAPSPHAENLIVLS
jgi:hypothetical protein